MSPSPIRCPHVIGLINIYDEKHRQFGPAYTIRITLGERTATFLTRYPASAHAHAHASASASASEHEHASTAVSAPTLVSTTTPAPVHASASAPTSTSADAPAPTPVSAPTNVDTNMDTDAPTLVSAGASASTDLYLEHVLARSREQREAFKQNTHTQKIALTDAYEIIVGYALKAKSNPHIRLEAFINNKSTTLKEWLERIDETNARYREERKRGYEKLRIKRKKLFGKGSILRELMRELGTPDLKGFGELLIDAAKGTPITKKTLMERRERLAEREEIDKLVVERALRSASTDASTDADADAFASTSTDADASASASTSADADADASADASAFASAGASASTSASAFASTSANAKDTNYAEAAKAYAAEILIRQSKTPEELRREDEEELERLKRLVSFEKSAEDSL